MPRAGSQARQGLASTSPEVSYLDSNPRQATCWSPLTVGAQVSGLTMMLFRKGVCILLSGEALLPGRQGPLETFFHVEETPQAVYVKTWDSPSEATLGLAVSEEAWDKILYLSTVAWSYLSSKQALRRSVRHSKGESLLCPD